VRYGVVKHPAQDGAHLGRVRVRDRVRVRVRVRGKAPSR